MFKEELTLEEMDKILTIKFPTMPLKLIPSEPIDRIQLRDGRFLEDEVQCVMFKELMNINPYYDTFNYPRNDKGMVNLCASVLKPLVVFCRDDQKYYVYDGVKWCLDLGSLRTSNLLKQLFLLLTKIYMNEIDFEGESEEEERDEAKNYFKYLERYDSKNKRDSVLKDMQDELVIDFSEFDKDPYIINLKNYTLNIKNLTYYDHRPSDMLTMVTNCNLPTRIEEVHKGKRFKDFFIQIMNGNQEKADFLQEALGYSILGTNPRECMFIAYGKTTRNGKSTLFNTITDLMGDYGNNTNARFLNKSISKNDTDKPSPTLASLKGKRVINLQESDKHASFDGALIKQITGNDTLQGRNLHENLSQFKVGGKIWYSCNYLPYIDDKTLFSSERLIVIEFDKHFSAEERDTTLKSIFAQEQIKSAIFFFLIEGFHMYLKNNLKLPDCVKDAITRYELSCNPIARFIKLRYEITNNSKDRIERTKLYEVYVSWCAGEGISTVKKSSFYEEIEAQGLRPIIVHGIRYISGLKLKEVTTK